MSEYKLPMDDIKKAIEEREKYWTSEEDFKIKVPNPLPPEVIAKLQDERSGTHTTINYMSEEEIKEKFGVDLPNDKYFTPSIEDIHVGYECESLNALPEEERYWIPYVIGETTGTWNQFGGIRWAVENKHLRVPYLTKEQIEKEGWVKRTKWLNDEEKQRLGWMPDYELQTDFGSLRLYIRDLENPWKHISIEKYVKSKGEPWQMSSFEPVFRGQCKDINTFRYICKLLKIN